MQQLLFLYLICFIKQILKKRRRRNMKKRNYDNEELLKMGVYTTLRTDVKVNPSINPTNYDPTACIAVFNDVAGNEMISGDLDFSYFVSSQSEPRASIGFPEKVTLKFAFYNRNVSVKEKGNAANATAEYCTDNGKIISVKFDEEMYSLPEFSEKKESIIRTINDVIKLFGLLNMPDTAKRKKTKA